MYDYRCRTTACRTRTMRLMLYLLLHNPTIVYSPNGTAADDIIKKVNVVVRLLFSFLQVVQSFPLFPLIIFLPPLLLQVTLLCYSQALAQSSFFYPHTIFYFNHTMSPHFEAFKNVPRHQLGLLHSLNGSINFLVHLPLQFHLTPIKYASSVPYDRYYCPGFYSQCCVFGIQLCPIIFIIILIDFYCYF